MPVTYANYLKVKELTDLQIPLSDGPEHDEMLFIVIHQVYELWFKQLLHEIDFLNKAFVLENETQCHLTFKRILTIFKTLVGQVDILETMTPVSFASFRERLDTASGFQSIQFREIEFALGAKSESALKMHKVGSPEYLLLEKRLHAPTVMDYFVRHLAKLGYAVPERLLLRDVKTMWSADKELQDIFIQIYKNQEQPMFLCERLVDLDEGLQEWRYRHVKMVERTIGAKIGTGGSAGAEYLKRTLFSPIFPDLWEIRVNL